MVGATFLLVTSTCHTVLLVQGCRSAGLQESRAPNSKKIGQKIGFWLDESLAPSPSDPLTLLGANRPLAPKSEHKCMEGCT